jgi:hypothetical protein
VTIAAAIADGANGGCFAVVDYPKSVEVGFVAGICMFELKPPIIIPNSLRTG